MFLLFILLSACQPLIKSPPAAPPEPMTQSYGHEQGNGSDLVPDNIGKAWFLGEEKQIHYCVLVAPNFGVPEADIKIELNKAFQIWQDYIKNKQINEAIENELTEGLRPHYPQGLPVLLKKELHQLRLTTNTVLKNHCDGTEEIKFYFGIEDERIVQNLKNYFNPISFALKISNDDRHQPSQGLVWVMKQGDDVQPPAYQFPNWKLKNRLLGVLLHEIGHIYGNGHIKNTIMEEATITNQIDLAAIPNPNQTDRIKWENYIQYKLSHIDHEITLFTPLLKKDLAIYEGRLSFEQKLNDQSAQENFQFLTGHKAKGDPKALLSQEKLTLMDDTSSFEFKLSFNESNSVAPQLKVFNVYKSYGILPPALLPGGLGSIAWSAPLVSSVITGSLERVSGERIPILLKRNIGYIHLSLTFFKGAEENALLIMDDLLIKSTSALKTSED